MTKTNRILKLFFLVTVVLVVWSIRVMTTPLHAQDLPAGCYICTSDGKGKIICVPAPAGTKCPELQNTQ